MCATDGIPPMVQAAERLHNEGRPFKIGLFYDTTILANADLTTASGKEYFYVNVRDYYSRIPPRFWAAIDGRPGHVLRRSGVHLHRPCL